MAYLKSKKGESKITVAVAEKAVLYLVISQSGSFLFHFFSCKNVFSLEGIKVVLLGHRQEEKNLQTALLQAHQAGQNG